MNELALSCIKPDDVDLAGEYAFALARDPANAYGVAMRLTFGDVSKATEMATLWRNDQLFQSAVREAMRNMDENDKLQTKEEFCVEVQEKLSQLSGKVWIEGAKFYAELRGFISKEQAPNTLIQNVIQLPADASADDWEKKAAAQQKKLQDEAKLINVNN